MLVLSRQRDERIIIQTPEGREITLVVCALGIDSVRLGIQADRDVIVHREEVIRRIREEGARR